MPKLGCPCGYVHSLSPIPDDGWITIRDRDYESRREAEALFDQLCPEGDPQKQQDRISPLEMIRRCKRSLYECPECGRILWESEDGAHFRCFRPDPIDEGVNSPDQNPDGKS
jgi:hypothetical protein